MTNAVFTPFLEGLEDDTISLSVGVVKASFVRGYTFSAAHKFVSDAVTAGGTINGTSAALTTKTFSGGVFDADDTTVSTTANATNHGILLYQASAVTGGADVATSAQRLIAYYDTGTGLPIQPGTGSTPITWDNGTNKILKIS